jgi:hypothetical protein
MAGKYIQPQFMHRQEVDLQGVQWRALSQVLFTKRGSLHFQRSRVDLPRPVRCTCQWTGTFWCTYVSNQGMTNCTWLLEVSIQEGVLAYSIHSVSGWSQLVHNLGLFVSAVEWMDYREPGYVGMNEYRRTGKGDPGTVEQWNSGTDLLRFNLECVLNYVVWIQSLIRRLVRRLSYACYFISIWKYVHMTSLSEICLCVYREQLSTKT